MEKPIIKLILSVKAEKWRAEDPESHEQDEEFKLVRPKVLKDDNFTCRACGFFSYKWQEVHHLNDDHSDNSMKNLATLCSFCHSTQHIGLAGKKKEGILIWLPEISQTALHHIVRAILVSEYEGKKSQSSEIRQIAEAGKVMYDMLRSREADAKKMTGTSNPEVLGDILWRIANGSGDKFYPRREMMLNGIRLLPTGQRRDEQNNKDIMAEMLQEWTGLKGSYGKSRNIKDWKNLLTSKIGSS